MVKSAKKTSRKSSEVIESVEETKVQEIQEEIYESDLVKLKKENQKAMDKQVKLISTSVKQNLEGK